MRATIWLFLFFSWPVQAATSCHTTWEAPLADLHGDLLQMRDALSKPGQDLIDLYLENPEFFSQVVKFMIQARREVEFGSLPNFVANRYFAQSDYWFSPMTSAAARTKLRADERTRPVMEEFDKARNLFL